MCFIFFSPISLFAANPTDPASIEYVDKVFADLQKQIDALNNSAMISQSTMEKGRKA